MKEIEVAVLTEDPEDPSARHRWRYPARHFRKAGVHVTLHPVQPPSRRGEAFRAAGEADLVVIHRKLFRFLDFHRLLRRARGRLVFDLDDAVMLRPTGRRRHWSPFRALRFARTVSQSSLFLAGNRYLADRAPRRVPVRIRPTPVDCDRYFPRETWPARGRLVGWIGTEATLPYLLDVIPALRALARRREDVALRVIGPSPPEIPGLRVERVPFSERKEADDLRALDVGILPLPDDPWTRGKCAFKALQYMAAGLPVVASPVGMTEEVVEHGVTGYLARSEEEWVDYLDRILDGPTLRELMGSAGRKRAEERYATSVLAPRTAEALRALAERLAALREDRR